MPTADKPKEVKPISPDPALSTRVANVARKLALIDEDFCNQTLKMATAAAARIIRNPTNTRDWTAVNALLGAGLHPDEVMVGDGMQQSSLLMVAAGVGDKRIVEMLLGYGADKAKKDGPGKNAQTAADRAKTRGHEDLAVLLRATEKLNGETEPHP